MRDLLLNEEGFCHNPLRPQVLLHLCVSGSATEDDMSRLQRAYNSSCTVLLEINKNKIICGSTGDEWEINRFFCSAKAIALAEQKYLLISHSSPFDLLRSPSILMHLSRSRIDLPLISFMKSLGRIDEAKVQRTSNSSNQSEHDLSKNRIWQLCVSSNVIPA